MSGWTPAKDAKLLIMFKNHDKLATMARIFNCSITTCSKRLQRLLNPDTKKVPTDNSKPAAEPKKALQLRRCLKSDCRRWFQPTYAGQYFHPQCKPTESANSFNARLPAGKPF